MASTTFSIMTLSVDPSAFVSAPAVAMTIQYFGFITKYTMAHATLTTMASQPAITAMNNEAAEIRSGHRGLPASSIVTLVICAVAYVVHRG